MPTTLSPFRYVQLARYVIQRWMESTPTIAPRLLSKGKERQSGAGSSVTRKLTGGSIVNAAVQNNNIENGKIKEDNQNIDSKGLGVGIPPSVGQLPIAGPSNSSSPRRDLRPDPRLPPEPNDIYRLMNDERLFVKGHAAEFAPREIIVLCHGLYGFSTSTPIPLFPSLKLHYWKAVLEVLRDRMGAKVLVVGVNGTGSIKERAEQMHDFLRKTLPKGTGVNFVAHSMGGLDVRHLISTIKPTTYTPLSLTSIGTPHRGSPFMDWCAANIGVGTSVSDSVGQKLVNAAATAATAGSVAAKALPYSLKSPILSRTPETSKESGSFTAALTSYLLNIFDSPAYSNLTTTFLRDHFNPNTPDSPNVKYISVAGRTRKMSVLHPLWFPKLVVDAAAENGYAEDHGSTGTEYEGNDGLVSVSSAKWGQFLGAVDPCHHWDLRGEGGIFPSGAALETKPQGRPDNSVPGGWDWGGSLHHELGSELGLGAASSSSNSNSSSASSQSQREREAQSSALTMASNISNTMSDHARAIANSVRENANSNLSHIPGFSSSNDDSNRSISSKSSPSQSSWDIAQVGQVLDWVKDIIPGNIVGNDGSKVESETNKKQMADARKEKLRDEERARGVDNSRNGNNVDGKRQMDKFDLARFYGGLMLKLRDDGF